MYWKVIGNHIQRVMDACHIYRLPSLVGPAVVIKSHIWCFWLLLSPAGLKPGREIIKCILWVRTSICALVCHADFSKTTTATDILSINCRNEFSRP